MKNRLQVINRVNQLNELIEARKELKALPADFIRETFELDKVLHYSNGFWEATDSESFTTLTHELTFSNYDNSEWQENKLIDSIYVYNKSRCLSATDYYIECTEENLEKFLIKLYQK